MQIPIFYGQKQRAWPFSGEPPQRAEQLALRAALSARFAFDAHFACYSPSPQASFRLRGVALRTPPELELLNLQPLNALAQLGGAVQMQLLCFDFDCKAAHSTGTEAPPSWRLEFWRAALRCLQRHPGGWGWDSRGGARLLWRLPQPWPLSSPAHAQEWSCYYRAFCLYLAEQFGLQADRLVDWTRLFRLPGADRGRGFEPGRQPLGPPPAQLGAFALPAPQLFELAQRARLQPASAVAASSYPLRLGAPFNPLAAGLLPTLLWQRGALGRELAPGKWCVRCPGPGNEHGLASDSVCWASGEIGVLFCSHDRCQGWVERGLEGALSLFSEAEFAAAARACSGGLC